MISWGGYLATCKGGVVTLRICQISSQRSLESVISYAIDVLSICNTQFICINNTNSYIYRREFFSDHTLSTQFTLVL